jgi:hypothetical protein
MELKEIVIVEMPPALIRPPKAKPCCRVCFEPETPQKFFIVEDLECGCNPYLHETCVTEWFRIAGREVCPQCGKEWKVVDPCLRYESFCARCAVCLILLALSVLAGTGLYQIITVLYLSKS